MPGYTAQGGTARRRTPNSNSPFSYVPEAQDYLRESVQGFGEQLQPQILKDIGATLGGLNEAGGLRSGGATVALGDLGQKYADMIGAHAKEATRYGLEAGLSARRQAHQERQDARNRKFGLLKAIGSVLGAGVGFIAAGPAGAVAGAGIASGGGVQGGQRIGDRFYPGQQTN